jgi:hypothetical protein
VSLFYIFLVWAIRLTLPVLVITVPDLLELVGIGFSGFYIYQNLLFKPDRAALKDSISKSLDKVL